MCTKCHDRGRIVQIDGAIVTYKACDCEIAKENAVHFFSRMEELTRQINESLAKT